ncbi:hypothetical protein [Thalassospira povalilytica]|uniref:Uncharacterized protein n=1 Tax=Thalassospira povalilytica TaxID=732237 RepID=A0A8I1SK73_9PROT|nr:hypothetical protein [Thalassospira povalilytica]MBN8197664.1 hypothetical protein [Thalassospira povalilytica]
MNNISTSDLDTEYGPLLSPNRVDSAERRLKPLSLHELNSGSATLLEKMMATSVEGLKVSSYVFSELPILWIVDKNGKLWFALEEIVLDATDKFRYPKPSKLDVPNEHSKLGHPSLVNAEEARIAGEMLFDIRAEPPNWYLTNASGRYGLHKTRNENHLLSVVKLFQKYGIELKHQFLPAAKMEK